MTEIARAARRPRKNLIAALILCVLLAVFLYAWLWEPYWIEATHHSIEAAVSSPIKIAHLTDLHTRGLGRREQLVLDLLDKEKPQVIVITGDTLANHGTTEMMKPVLSRLRAPLGVWVVRGNWENWLRDASHRSFYDSVGVRLLVNKSEQITNDVWIVGLDDRASGSPNPAKALEHVPPKAFTIALIHSPAGFELIAGKVSLVLAGHTHGGQVNLPFLGPLWLPRGVNGFLAGWYERHGTRMYVSRGIGTSIYSVRFLARPEVAFIELRPKKKEND